ncbi:MAG TPA: hypothetical protein VK050_03715 [Flavobacteriaceae bacterium]|nr:hypothetical protein [Flavobacteriaceae bacterium]
MSQLNPELNLKLESFFEEVKINMHQLADKAARNIKHHNKRDPLKNLSKKFDTLPRLIESLTSDLESYANKALEEFDEKIKKHSKTDREIARRKLRDEFFKESKIVLSDVTKQFFNN